MAGSLAAVQKLIKLTFGPDVENENLISQSMTSLSGIARNGNYHDTRLATDERLNDFSFVTDLPENTDWNIRNLPDEKE